MGTIIEQHVQLEAKYQTSAKCEIVGMNMAVRRRTNTNQFNSSKQDAPCQCQSSSNRWIRIQQIKVIYVTDTLVVYKQKSCI